MAFSATKLKVDNDIRKLQRLERHRDEAQDQHDRELIIQQRRQRREVEEQLEAMRRFERRKQHERNVEEQNRIIAERHDMEEKRIREDLHALHESVEDREFDVTRGFNKSKESTGSTGRPKTEEKVREAKSEHAVRPTSPFPGHLAHFTVNEMKQFLSDVRLPPKNAGIDEKLNTIMENQILTTSALMDIKKDMKKLKTVTLAEKMLLK